MTDITAKIVADSISPAGRRLTTIQMRYPRFIHAENKTHRLLTEHGAYDELDDGITYGGDTPIGPSGLMYEPALSRNARSSRAVPVETMIREIMENPVIPIHWGANQRGMQADQESDAPLMWPHPLGSGPEFARTPIKPEDGWLWARDRAVEVARIFHEAGYHKQVINRLLEPFMHIDTLVSATEWTNFLGLRDHHMAEPHIRKLAQEVKAAMAASEPVLLQPGEWHLPYVDKGSDDAQEIVEHALERDLNPYELAIKISVARCARISYTPFDGNGSIEKELERHDLLVGSAPLHASPAEHQATPDRQYDDGFWRKPALHGNFVGWIQHRKTLAGEQILEAE